MDAIALANDIQSYEMKAEEQELNASKKKKILRLFRVDVLNVNKPQIFVQILCRDKV
jgi:hypothetical protein